MKRKKAILLLDDGAWWEGAAAGAEGEVFGELVFYTGVVGYQEVLTDPALAGKLVVMTYPHIGNYGIVPADDLSGRVWPGALLVKELSRAYSNWQARSGLPEFARARGLFILDEIDTQSVVRHLRDHGPRFGVISSRDASRRRLAGRLAEAAGRAAVTAVSGTAPIPAPGGSRHFVAYDFGARADSLRQLAALGGRVTLVPFDTPAEAVLELKPEAVFLSSGPGDPAGLSKSLTAIRTLSEKLPILAFGLGFQILCLALGAAAFRMKTGHYGLNQPVQDLASRRCLSTSQCHSLAIDPASLGPDLLVTHLNLNDRTVEGVRHRERPLAGLQYYPAADDPVFETFARLLNA